MLMHEKTCVIPILNLSIFFWTIIALFMKYKIVVPLFDAAFASPNKGITFVLLNLFLHYLISCGRPEVEHVLNQSFSTVSLTETIYLRRLCLWNNSYADPEGGDRGSGPHLKNHKNIGFLSNTGLDPLKITKLPSQQLGHHRHASETPFKWRFAGRLMMVRL